MNYDDLEHGKNEPVGLENTHPAASNSSRPKRTPPTGRIAAIERAIFAQDWREARRLADREDSGNEI